jgi:hypothetical protein
MAFGRRRLDQRRRPRVGQRGIRDQCRRRRSCTKPPQRIRGLLPRRRPHRPAWGLRSQIVDQRPSRRFGARDRARNRPRRDPRVARARSYSARGGCHQHRQSPSSSPTSLSPSPQPLALVGPAGRRSRILALWILVMAVSSLASLAGYALLQSPSRRAIACVLAFAGGAILISALE